MQGSEQADKSWGFNCEWAKKRIANCADKVLGLLHFVRNDINNFA
ncbi:hypothetical protein GXM_02235 [Nostoc sphaeroides CCNUC1]|uniref:Uncharacterized protein n=1 Tax=Nostoc sphaeroides CCNUC1 TaxID=2653204 RepID=A0A5P8VWJ6_9NOSO|nr:hypothetical protein GXM_02235 [Nostoc sphaeroides CCNUC1]